MQKIIKSVLQSLIDNASLIWILFFGNILFSYISYRMVPAGSIFFVVLFSLAAIYLFSAVMQGIVLYYQEGGWNWVRILAGGLKNFPVMVLWLLLCLGITVNSIIGLSRIYGAGASFLWPVIFFLSGYITGLPAAGLYSDLSLKESLCETAGIVKTKPAIWALGGVFLIFLLIATGAAAELMTVLAAYSYSAGIGIVSPLFIASSEFVRAGSVVATMSTIASLRL